MQAVRAKRVIGLDSSHYLEPKLAAWLMSSTAVKFVVRYVNRSEGVRDTPDARWPISLSRRELGELVEAGIPISVTQFYGRAQGAADGRRVGEAMAANAEALKLPKGATLWCDAEWNTPEKRPPKGDRIAYLKAWAKAVKLAGFSSIGLYVGAGVDLSPDELYHDLPTFSRYWKSLSRVATPAVRGYCLAQSWEYVLIGKGPPSVFRNSDAWRLVPMSSGNKRKGRRFDLDLAMIDSKGQRFTWITR